MISDIDLSLNQNFSSNQNFAYQGFGQPNMFDQPFGRDTINDGFYESIFFRQPVPLVLTGNYNLGAHPAVAVVLVPAVVGAVGSVVYQIAIETTDDKPGISASNVVIAGVAGAGAGITTTLGAVSSVAGYAFLVTSALSR